MATKSEKLTPQARASLRVVADILGEKFTGQILLECNHGGVRSITKKYKVPTPDEADKKSP